MLNGSDFFFQIRNIIINCFILSLLFICEFQFLGVSAPVFRLFLPVLIGLFFLPAPLLQVLDLILCFAAR